MKKINHSYQYRMAKNKRFRANLYAITLGALIPFINFIPSLLSPDPIAKESLKYSILKNP